MVGWISFLLMNTSVDFYPGVNGSLIASNGHNGIGLLPDHEKQGSDGRRELLTFARVDSEELLRELLRRIGEDPDREGLRKTPARIIRSWNELFAGYRQRAEDVLVTQFHADQYEEIVLLRDVEFCSTCEHHMLPFCGEAHIAYIPDKKIVGLSKLARLLDLFARRLQVQERLTRQIASELERVLKPKGVAVMIEGKHQCMSCRGVRKPGGRMVTSCLLGEFKENAASRTEFFSLLRS